MAVKELRAEVRLYPQGAPSYCEFAGQWQQVNFFEIYEAALMTGQILFPAFGGAFYPSYKPSLYLLPDPLNCLIPAFEIGLTKPHTYLSEWIANPANFVQELPPISAVDAQTLIIPAVLPDQQWQLISRFSLAPNQPFAVALVLFPAVKDNLSMPYVRIIFGQGEWEILLRPEVDPVLVFRGQPVLPIGHVFGEVWRSGSFMQVEGAIGTFLILPVRGHLVIANARDWNPTKPNISAFNPYIYGKNFNEPIILPGEVIVEGRGAAAIFAFPSIDFATHGGINLPLFTIYGARCPRVYDPITIEMLNHQPSWSFRANLFNFKHSTDKVSEMEVTVYGVSRHAPTTLTFSPLTVTEDKEAKATSWVWQLRFSQPTMHSFFELVAISVHGYPAIKELPARKLRRYINLTKDYAVTEIQISLDEGHADAQITFAPKHPHQTLPVISSDQYVEIEVDWTNLKGQKQKLVFKGFVSQVVEESREGGWGAISYRLVVSSIMRRLESIVGDGLFPVFDGWKVSEVFAYALKRAGLDPDQFLFFYGNDVILSPEILWEQPTPPELPPPLMPQPPVSGFPYWWVIEQPRFTIKVGQSLVEFLKELARMTGNEIIVDGEGLWVIPTAYESPIVSYTIMDATKFGTTEPTQSLMNDTSTYLATEIHLKSEPAWLPTSFIAAGKTIWGTPIWLNFENNDAITNPNYPFFRGFRASTIISDDKLTTWFLLARAAYTEYLKQFRHIPTEINLTLIDIPANPYLGLRDRVLVQTQLTNELPPHPYMPAKPKQEFVVRKIAWVFSSDIARCAQRLTLTPPANIPYGVILPRR